MPRFHLLLSCLLVITTGAAVAGSASEATSTRPYVETSYLIAPRQVADFALEKASFNPARKYAGAGFRYRLDGHPAIRIDIYVYPAGRMSQAQAMDSGMKDFHAGLEQAVDQGTYSHLTVLDQTPFTLTPPAEEKVPANAFDAQVINAIAEMEQINGNRLRLELGRAAPGMAVHSNGYLFYKQLHYFKLRISASPEGLSQEAFDALTDRAARILVPALQAANVGGCANATITLSADAPPEQMALAMVRQSRMHRGYNCHLDDAAAIPAERRAASEVIQISYSADEWKSQ